MSRRVIPVPFADDLLSRVADLLLEEIPGAVGGDLSGGLVLLPSSRACHDLRRTLLAASGREALLLPRITTDGAWADELAFGLGLDDTDLPDDAVRSLLLARRLAGADWLAGGAAAAPGLAESFVGFFDEIRLHRVDGRILRARDTAPLVELASPAEAETVAAEVARIRQVWELYRRDVPRDAVDRLMDLDAALREGRGLPAGRPALVVVAGFGRVDPLRAGVLAAALDHGREAALFVPEARGVLDRRFTTTWGAAEAAVDPLAPTRRLLAALGEEVPGPPDQDEPLSTRLAALDDAGVSVTEGGPRLLRAEDPEAEAVAVAGLVAGHLEQGGAVARGITIAANDPRLAARITARLRDAGLDADNTVGEPLGSLPAGLLLRFLLRATSTGLRAEPLLEVLGHPYTRLTDGEVATGTWALRLERMFRRETGPQSGLAGLHRRARDRDAAALALFRRQAAGMEEFVARVAESFGPLLDLQDGPARPWSDFLAAARRVWAAVAPERPLGENPEWPDVTALAGLLDRLETGAGRLPRTDLAGFAADLGRLLADTPVVAHRPRGIPVVVTGLVEARLARSDLLVLAGMNDGVFPAGAAVPVVLPGRVRRELELPTWREARARDAELLLRLLHAAPQVAVTWSAQRDQQPALPSPFVERLQLALGGDEPERAPTTVWRAAEAPDEAIAAGQAAFAAEPLPVPRHAEARPQVELSWSALARWRDCPYRGLLERGFALRAEEEVREEFGRREYGSVVHEVLREALAPDADCHAALAAGREDAAVEALRRVAADRFLPGVADLPERRLWFDAFAGLVPGIVAVELARFAAWRPAAVEAEFVLPLADLLAWARRHLDLPDLPAHALPVQLRGAVDRVDRNLADPSRLAVLDYKTGQAPPVKRITELEDLQLALYALAVELGTVEGCAGAAVESAFYALDDKGCGPVVPAKKDHPLSREPGDPGLLADGARALIELAVRASDPEAPADLLPRFVRGEATGKLPCHRCDHRGTCRVEERGIPELVVGLDDVVNAREVAT
jgi:ATP-dependent helicase/nuclease subunit B